MDTFINQIQQTSLVEWLGTATGLLGVYLSIKEKTLAWPFYILCYGLYAYLSFSAGLYATLALNICFIPISIYGWWQWTHPTQSSDDTASTSISALRGAALLWTIVLGIAGTFLIGALLSHYTTGAAPYLDAFATTLSFLAQWMLGKKFIENWLAWIVADIAFVILWGSQGYWVAVAMFLVFTALALLGYLSWQKEIRRHAS